MGMLLSIIPQELWVLVFVVAALGVIVGIVPKGAIVGLIIGMVVLSVMGPIVDSLISALPWYVSVILTIVFALTFINWVITLIFGKRTGSHLAALILHDIFLMPFRVVGFFFGRR